jgi:hypothetical protein
MWVLSQFQDSYIWISVFIDMYVIFLVDLFICMYTSLSFLQETWIQLHALCCLIFRVFEESSFRLGCLEISRLFYTSYIYRQELHLSWLTFIFQSCKNSNASLIKIPDCYSFVCPLINQRIDLIQHYFSTCANLVLNPLIFDIWIHISRTEKGKNIIKFNMIFFNSILSSFVFL